MKVKNLIPKFLVVLGVLIAFASCEEDFSIIDSNVIDQNLEIKDTVSSVLAYSRKLLPVQTNFLPVYQLGVYNDPVYGKSTVDFLGQITMNAPDPDFPDDSLNFEIESVILNVPFISESTTDADGGVTYTLDSVFGTSPLNISVFESTFFLNDLDPDSGFEDPQNYYSNQGPTFEGFLGEMLGEQQDFVPSAEEIEIITDNEDTLTFPPGLVMQLDKDFFQKRIIDMEGTPELDNNNNFREYLRGLFFKVTEVDGGDNLFIFNGGEATVTINYTADTTELDADGNQVLDDNGDIVRVESAFGFQFNAINVNVFDGDIPAAINDAISNPNVDEGEETLYIKGGEGIVSIIELFGEDFDDNGVADDLEFFREKEWLINEANLIFYVDQNQVSGGASEPERITIFDIERGTFLDADRFFDITATEDPFTALNIHLGPLERGSDETGEFYKIRVTNHVSNIINRDSTNVPLGLIVSQNVLLPGFQDLENPQSPGIETVPSSSVVSRQGTVLHGNRSTNPAKRLKLQIFYTEPDK